MLIIIVFNYVKTAHKLPNKKPNSYNKSLTTNTKNNNVNNHNKKSKLNSQQSNNNYDFYNLLPNANAQTSNTLNITTPTTTVNKINNVNNKISTSLATPNKNQYLLQIGSFHTIEEADELKAKLALHGFEANIETTTSASTKDSNYKVILGPFASQSIAMLKKEQIDSAGFKNILVKNN